MKMSKFMLTFCKKALLLVYKNCNINHHLVQTKIFFSIIRKMKQFLINTLIISKHAGAELVCGRLMGN